MRERSPVCHGLFGWNTAGNAVKEDMYEPIDVSTPLVAPIQANCLPGASMRALLVPPGLRRCHGNDKRRTRSRS